MNFFSFCRRGALTGMLLLLGITSAQAADWPRQVTDSYGTHTLPSQPLLSLIHISEPTRPVCSSRMPSSA